MQKLSEFISDVRLETAQQLGVEVKDLSEIRGVDDAIKARMNARVQLAASEAADRVMRKKSSANAGAARGAALESDSAAASQSAQDDALLKSIDRSADLMWKRYQALCGKLATDGQDPAPRFTDEQAFQILLTELRAG